MYVAPLAALAILIFRFPGLGLVLCLVVGSFFKGMLQPQLGPIDITAYLFIVTFGSIFIRSSMEKKLALPGLGINIGVLLLVAIYLASLLYTPLISQGTDVFLRFVFLNTSVMYGTFIWCKNIERIERLLFTFIGIVLAYSVFAFIWVFPLGQMLYPGSRSPFPETPVLGIAQYLVAGIIVAFIIKDLIRGKYMRWTLNLLLIISAVELITLNSRGPLIAFVAGIIFLFLLYSPREKKRFAFYAAIPVAAMIFAFILLPSQFTGRYEVVTQLESSSIAARLDMWRFVAEHFSDWFFLGTGIYGFAYYYWPGQTGFSIYGAYPHNIFLDIFAALGIFGLLVFVWLIGSLFYKGIKMSQKREQSFHLLSLAIVLPFITFLIAGLFSMSVIGTRPLWFFGGMILSLERCWIKRDRENIAIDVKG